MGEPPRADPSGDALTHQFNSTVNFESKEAAVLLREVRMGVRGYGAAEDGKGRPTIQQGRGLPNVTGDNFAVARKGIPVWPIPESTRL